MERAGGGVWETEKVDFKITMFWIMVGTVQWIGTREDIGREQGQLSEWGP